MTNSGAYPADFQAPKSLDGWGTQQALDVVCDAGAMQAWMMFDGMFNDVRHMFAAEWAPRVYALRPDGHLKTAEIAIDDEQRQSSHWAQRVDEARQRFLQAHPTVQFLYGAEES